MQKRKLWAISLLAGVSLLVGACAPQSIMEGVEEMPIGEPSYDESYTEESFEKAEAEESGRGFTSGISESASPVERMVVYNADLEIAVEDPEVTLKDVIALAEDSGGFVVSSNLSKTYPSGDRAVPRAYVTVRIPAEQLDSILEEIRNLTPNPKEDVIHENVSGQDVTAEYTDLESRLRNLEAAEEALVELMDQAYDPEDVLNIFDELTYYRGEIEVVKGRMKYLEESAALSAVSVEIVAKESLQPIEIAGWQPQGTVKKAVEALINAAQFIADAAIWFGIFCLPFLIPLGVGVYVLVRLIKKRNAKKKAKKTEVVAQGQQDKE